MAVRNATFPETILEELVAAGQRSHVSTQADKKNYAEAFSRALALRFANQLRATFPGILPNEDGSRQESYARSSRGVKKLDVNYSTPELGLGLGVSIKTLNFRDAKSNRYTKNYTRIDNELRAEAHDYHERQPFSVLIAIIFLPHDSYDDGGKSSPSSFGSAVQLFRNRAGRKSHKNSEGNFEGVFIGTYVPDGTQAGNVEFFNVMSTPPKTGRPKNTWSIKQLVSEITAIYDARNNPKDQWAE